MTAMEISIEKLLGWSDPKRVRTKLGERDLRVARPDVRFWELWRSQRTELKKAGISCGKNKRSGEWEVCWWQPISESEQIEKEEAVAASRAETADIDVPSPEGLEYLPYQLAGIAYALRIFGDIK